MCFDIREMLGIKELSSEVNAIKQNVRDTLRPQSTETHIFTIQKPFCCPAGKLVREALDPYGVKILNLSADQVVNVSTKDFAQMARIELKRMENIRYGPVLLAGWLPYAMTVDVTVRETQAEWAEYLLERTLRMCVVKGNINGKNRSWANQHKGEMPKPWIEKSCSDGNKIWQQVDGIMKEKDNVQRKAK
jgi:hypothetical protein